MISAGSRAERPALQPPLDVALGSETSYFELARAMADEPAEPASGAPTRVPLRGVSENKGQPAFSFGSPGSAPSFSFGPKAAAAAVAPGETFVFGARGPQPAQSEPEPRAMDDHDLEAGDTAEEERRALVLAGGVWMPSLVDAAAESAMPVLQLASSDDDEDAPATARP